MKLSDFGEKFTKKTGILELMDDLGKAMNGSEKMLMLGGGNPAHLPQIDEIWRKRWEEIQKNGDEIERLLGNYTTSQGNDEFINSVAGFFKEKYGWKVSAKNVAVLNGSQNAFFFLFNMLAGQSGDRKRKILLPIVPEYIGYADQGITEDMFISCLPEIEYLNEHTFKYKINFDNIQITDDIAAICVSRPTNPTGNVITDDEVKRLQDLASLNNIPLIIDNAYGAPFPNILFTTATPIWDENIVNVLTLSKLGLPSARTSIVIAAEEIINYLISINAITSLSTGTIGQHLVMPLFKSNEINKICDEYIQPFYKNKSELAVKHFHSEMAGSEIPYFLHKSEGALFLWLWCKNLPITSYELYQRLKNRNVLVVPGQYFYPGLKTEWKHTDECLRITYSQKEEDVKMGLSIIAEEVKKAYNSL